MKIERDFPGQPLHQKLLPFVSPLWDFGAYTRTKLHLLSEKPAVQWSWLPFLIVFAPIGKAMGWMGDRMLRGTNPMLPEPPQPPDHPRLR
jgi:hypothetical protein